MCMVFLTVSKTFPPSGCCGSAKSLNFTEYLTSEVLLNSPNILLNSPYYLFGLSANLEQGNRGCCRPSTRILLSVIGVQTVLIRIQPKKNIMKIIKRFALLEIRIYTCLLYTSPSPRDKRQSRMPSSA